MTNNKIQFIAEFVIDITGRKEAIKQALENIQELSDNTSDLNVLDRVLCLLTQAVTSLKSVTQSLPESEVSSYEVKEKFAPA